MRNGCSNHILVRRILLDGPTLVARGRSREKMPDPIAPAPNPATGGENVAAVQIVQSRLPGLALRWRVSQSDPVGSEPSARGGKITINLNDFGATRKWLLGSSGRTTIKILLPLKSLLSSELL
ncbi:hypothetical protein NDU88_002420 [Pleurodeles waltl]|uniref:Uncharacterized protein n=1 Tax=Pleurodeles waltl TaxID=8319 RepID=A0AAV7U9R5_PLEWA|nr:hypothetical protein NDU88_002420 [Pleurodeles waltl]